MPKICWGKLSPLPQEGRRNRGVHRAVDRPDEMLAVVDERNRVIGQQSRHAIHEQGLRHRAVHVMVRHGNGKWFLQQRSYSKDCNPGAWDSSAAGHVDFGESYLACAVRELSEELGIDTSLEQPKELFMLIACEETGMEFCSIFQVDHDGPFELDRVEVLDGKWVLPVELDLWIESGGQQLTETFQLIWQIARDQFEK